MSDKPRFILSMTLMDRHREQETISMAIGLDHELRISNRAVDESKVGLGTFNDTVRLMRTRSFRKKVFIAEATRLGALLAERMEDAEGWHDAERIEPAQKQLGGRWKP